MPGSAVKLPGSPVAATGGGAAAVEHGGAAGAELVKGEVVLLRPLEVGRGVREVQRRRPRLQRVRAPVHAAVPVAGAIRAEPSGAHSGSLRVKVRCHVPRGLQH
eukprot:309230-Prorocentrum_minimum.AAC.1